MSINKYKIHIGVPPRSSAVPSRRRPRLGACVAFLCCFSPILLFLSRPASALTPDQIAILENLNSPKSEEVALHYARLRHIPEDHIIPLRLPPSDDLAEVQYRTYVVPLVRDYLTNHKLKDQVTCLVTTYGIPLKIGAQALPPPERAEFEFDRANLVIAMRAVKNAIGEYNAIAPAPAPPATTSAPATATAPAGARNKAPELPALPVLITDLQTSANAALARIEALPATARHDPMTAFLNLHEKVAGVVGVIAISKIPVTSDQNPAIDARNILVRDADKAQERYAVLNKDRKSAANRKEMIDLERKFHGLLGQIDELSLQIPFLERDQSETAFDNELMLLWVDDFERTRWLSNPMNIEYWNAGQPPKDRIMITARIDGSTPAMAIAMVERGIAIEKTGLTGRVYFDARGLRGTDGYSTFDADIRTAATYLKDNTDLNVTIDDTGNFLQAKDCPDCALYCGWYSLHNYLDSCQWNPGAVGYHVASMELASLHNPKETAWCVNLLNRGFCGTLGPTHEPYLTAFPKPSLFFPLLVSGQFTQGEVYYLTLPWISWRIALVGDPLYNPFQAKPHLSIEKLRQHTVLSRALQILPRPITPAPQTAPATIPVPSPAH